MRLTSGLSHSHIPKTTVGRKSYLNKAQIQVAREVMEGKKATIGWDIRVKKSHNRVS